MTTGPAPKCFSCAYFLLTKGPLACKAFPKGIPNPILDGDKEHDKIISGQVDDYIYTEKG